MPWRSVKTYCTIWLNGAHHARPFRHRRRGALPPQVETFEVRNPATGELIRTLPSLDAAAVAALVAEARAAQPGWEALGFDGRGAIFRAAQKWLIANSDRDHRDDLRRDRQDARRRAGRGQRLGPELRLLGEDGAEVPGRREALRACRRSRSGARSFVRYSPLGVIGVIGPWNYPLVNEFLRRRAGADGGQRGRAQALRGDAADGAADRGDDGASAGSRMACSRSRPAAAETGEALIDAGRHGDVHRLDPDRQGGDGARGEDADARVARARRQGSDDRAAPTPTSTAPPTRRRSTRCNNSGQICISVERVYVEEPIYDEFVAKVRRDRQGPAPGPCRGARRGRRRRDHTRPADRDRRAPRRGRRRAGRDDRRRRPPAPGRRALLRADGADRRRPHDGSA